MSSDSQVHSLVHRAVWASVGESILSLLTDMMSIKRYSIKLHYWSSRPKLSVAEMIEIWWSFVRRGNWILIPAGATSGRPISHPLPSFRLRRQTDLHWWCRASALHQFRIMSQASSERGESMQNRKVIAWEPSEGSQASKHLWPVLRAWVDVALVDAPLVFTFMNSTEEFAC